MVDERPRYTVEPRHVQRAIEAQLVLEPRNAVRATARRALSAISPPRRLPLASAVFIDIRGLLWVVLSTPGDSEVKLRAYAVDGTRQGNVTIPVDMDVLEIGNDYILGRSADAFGVAHVLEYGLRRK